MICYFYLKICLFSTIGFLALNQPQLVGAQNAIKKINTVKEEDIKQILTKKHLKYLKNVGNIVENVGLFIPEVSTAFKSTRAIWNILTATHSLVTGDQLEERKDSDRIHELAETTKQIEENTYIIIDMLDKLAEKIGDENIIDGILKTIFTNVQIVYSYYIELSNLVNFNDTRKLSNFCQSMINPATGVQKQIRKIYGVIDANGKKFFDLLKDKRQVEEMMCKNKRPTMHLLYDIYGCITLSEIKALLILQYSGNYTNDPDMRFYQNGMKTRLTNLRADIKDAMMVAVKDFWRCEGNGIEGQDYGKVSPIFSLHFIRESEMMYSSDNGHFFEYQRPVFGTCNFYTNLIVSGGSSILNERFGGYQSCYGILRYCQLYKNSNEDLNVCVAETGEGRKYNKVISKEFTLGKDDYCDNKVVLRSECTWHHGCNDYCTCICDDYKNNSTNRYFNLRPVTSDILQNRVVTGVKISLKNKIFQLEIQEGKLMTNGNINKRTLRWKGNSFNITDSGVEEREDYHRITWQENRINTDELIAPNGTLLTGLKFELDSGVLKLAIRYTHFNFTTGELNVDSSAWISDNNDNRKESLLINPDAPSSFARHRPNLLRRSFIKFNISSIEKDVGQNIVPYIDLQSLTLDPPIPFSGAALIHKSSLSDAGYLAMKLIAYNYAPELPLDETWIN